MSPVIDALGRTLTLPSTPRRLVSLVPSLTEFLFHVGVGPHVVGVTNFCIEPKDDVVKIAKVGGPKNPDHEVIKDLRPDLVIASKEENKKEDVERLTRENINVYVTDVCSVGDVCEQLASLSGVVGGNSDVSERILQGISLKEREVREWAQKHSDRRKVIAFIWKEPWMAVGGGTYADSLLSVCGFENVARNPMFREKRYPSAELEEFMALDPEVILLPDEPYVFTQENKGDFSNFLEVSSVRQGRIDVFDGRLLTWYGGRTREALEYLSELARKPV